MSESVHSNISDILVAEALNHPYRDVRLTSAVTLLKMRQMTPQQKQSIVPVIIELLEYQWRSPNRQLAEQHLIEIGIPVIPYLIETWRDGGKFIENVLVAMGADTIPYIIDLLNDDDLEIRRQTIWLVEKMLEKMKNIPPEITPSLINALNDIDPVIRSRSAIILGDHKVIDTIPYLEKMLSDNEIAGEALTVADLAEVALARMNNDAAFDIAISHLVPQLLDTSLIHFKTGNETRSNYARRGLEYIFELTERPDVRSILDSHSPNPR